MKFQKLIVAGTLLVFSYAVWGKSVQLVLGTDFPYQNYIGVNYPLTDFDIAVKTGVLTPPYSSVLIKMFGAYGAEDTHLQLIDESFRFGWMNTLGVYYKTGKNKQWYVGADIRFDFLTTNEVPESALIEAVDTSLRKYLNFLPFKLNAELSVQLAGAGIRGGKVFQLDESGKHQLAIDISAFKYLYSKSTTKINEREFDIISNYVDDLIWEDVFKKYGYVVGIGISYRYRL